MIICKHCGSQAPRGRGGRKYCSAECRYIGTHGKPKQVKPTHCCVCKKPLTGRLKTVCSKKCRHKKSGMRLKELRDLQRVLVRCSECDNGFLTTSAQAKTCSSPCKVKRQKRLASEKWHESKQDRPHFKEIDCSYCSKPVTVPTSFTAGMVSHPECKIERKKARNRIKHTRRRGYRATLRNMSVEKMGDRDNWTCHICKEPVNPLLPSNHKEGASVDHVIPLSRGGTDEPGNLKLSHWICNVKKSNKVDYA